MMNSTRPLDTHSLLFLVLPHGDRYAIYGPTGRLCDFIGFAAAEKAARACEEAFEAGRQSAAREIFGGVNG